MIVPYGSKYVFAAAFSPVRNEIAIGGNDPDAYVMIYDLAAGRVTKKLAGHDDGVLGVADRATAAGCSTCSYDKTVRLWNTASGEEIRRFEGHTQWVLSAAFAAPRPRLARNAYRHRRTRRHGDRVEHRSAVGARRAVHGTQGPRLRRDARLTASTSSPRAPTRACFFGIPADVRPFDFEAVGTRSCASNQVCRARRRRQSRGA